MVSVVIVLTIIPVGLAARIAGSSSVTRSARAGPRRQLRCVARCPVRAGVVGSPGDRTIRWPASPLAVRPLAVRRRTAGSPAGPPSRWTASPGLPTLDCMISQSSYPHAPIDKAGLAAALRPFGESRMLPRAAYVDPAVFAWEQRHFFGGGWLCVGPQPQRSPSPATSGPGSRPPAACCWSGTTDGVLRAFANICRHRGHELLACGSHPAAQRDHLPVSLVDLLAVRRAAARRRLQGPAGTSTSQPGGWSSCPPRNGTGWSSSTARGPRRRSPTPCAAWTS